MVDPGSGAASVAQIIGRSSILAKTFSFQGSVQVGNVHFGIYILRQRVRV